MANGDRRRRQISYDNDEDEDEDEDEDARQLIVRFAFACVGLRCVCWRLVSTRWRVEVLTDAMVEVRVAKVGLQRRCCF